MGNSYYWDMAFEIILFSVFLYKTVAENMND